MRCSCRAEVVGGALFVVDHGIEHHVELRRRPIGAGGESFILYREDIQRVADQLADADAEHNVTITSDGAFFLVQRADVKSLAAALVRRFQAARRN